jgi:hypothetical protein
MVRLNLTKRLSEEVFVIRYTSILDGLFLVSNL